MRKISILAVCVLLAMVLSASSVFAQADTVDQQKELLYYDQYKAYNGYTVLPGGVIIDMEGNQVYSYSPNTSIGIWPDGHFLIGAIGTGGARGIQEVDFSGNVYLEWYNSDRPDLQQHHDMVQMYNTKLGAWTVAAIMYRSIDYDEAMANGVNPDTMTINEDTNITLGSIIEIDRNGNIVWEWGFWDHAVQDYDATKGKYGDPGAEENWGKVDINVPTNSRTGFSADWNHCNSMDYNAELDQFVINSREFSEFYIIDHNATFVSTAADFAADPAAAAEANRLAAAGPDGDFLYRWGNPFNYRQGDGPTFNNTGNEQIFGAHRIHWIPEGCPGAGNFLIFDNSHFRPQQADASYVHEINPFLDSEGVAQANIVREADAGYTVVQSGYNGTMNQSNQVVFSWRTMDYRGNNLFSWFISGCQRMPNGNTSACLGAIGHVVEVTPDKEVVWDYRTLSRFPFRAYRYPYDYSGFTGLDFKNMGPVSNNSFGGAMDRFQASSALRSGEIDFGYYDIPTGY